MGPVGRKLRELLQSSIEVPESSLTEDDEIHLIMEYKVGSLSNVRDGHKVWKLDDIIPSRNYTSYTLESCRCQWYKVTCIMTGWREMG